MSDDDEYELIERLVEALERIADGLDQLNDDNRKAQRQARKKNSP